MALQGSIDSFPMVDVLRLLGSTKKSGRLALHGDRGSANLWLDDGEVVSAEADEAPASGNSSAVVDVVFEMMRFGMGNFEFLADQLHPHPQSPRDVESLIAESVALMEEWLEIAESLPSMDQTIEMQTGIDSEVVLTPEMWRAVCCIGSGVSVKQLIRIGGWGELPTLRACRDLLEQDLISISDAEPEPDPSPLHTTATSPTAAPRSPSMFDPFSEDLAGNGPGSDSTDSDLLYGSLSAPTFQPPPPLPTPAPGSGGDSGSGEEVALGEPDPEGSEDWTQHLASLSPEVARAVAEAASETDEERARVLKFLGSV